MFAEKHGVVARDFGVEATVSHVIALDVAIAKDVAAVTVHIIVHGLDAADVAIETWRGIAKKPGGNVLDCIETKAVAFGGVERPHRRANQISADIFRDRLAVTVERMPWAAERNAIGIHVIRGIEWLTDEHRLGDGAAQ